MQKVIYDKINLLNQTVATDVLSVADAKTFLRVDSSDEDALISDLISVAVESVQKYTGHVFSYNETMELNLQRFEAVNLPLTPIVTINSISYRDVSNVQQTLNASSYWIEPLASTSNVLRFKGTTPSVYEYSSHPITVSVEIGYEETESIPPMMIHAVRLLVSQYYDQRENFIVGTSVSTELPNGLKSLLSPFRNIYFV